MRKKILWISDFSKLKSGFGRNSKTVLRYLYNTDKYDIVEVACAPFTFNDERLKIVPWKTYGSIPEDPLLAESIHNDPNIAPYIRYGAYYIDEIISIEKPDIFIGVNDFWAFSGYYDKPWWNKIPSALWVTADSLPIWKEAIEHGHKIKNFWVWSKFAENEMKRLGFPHVKTLHGAFDTKHFFPVPRDKKNALKQEFGIDGFVFGFVFRNQIRKLIGTLLEAFAEFKKTDTHNSKLLLHTSWDEGWDIPSFLDEFKINKSDVLTTHVCRACKKFSVRPFEGSESDCRLCGTPKAMITPNVGYGVSEEDMNIIYNLMDFYIHPITSGGLEMPIVESLLAGVPVATVNYSCGEEFCEQAFVRKIDHVFYREIGTQFKKSQPLVSSLVNVMQESVEVDLSENSRLGREWAIEQFDVAKICSKIEAWVDSQPTPIHDYEIKHIRYNADVAFNDSGDLTNEEWAIDLIKSVFGYEESKNSPTVKKILDNLQGGMSREEIYKKATASAATHNETKEKTIITNFFSDERNTNNIGIISPKKIGEKLILIPLVQKLAEKYTVVIVGDERDREIFSEFAELILLPYTDNTIRPSWLKNMRTSENALRLKGVFYKSGDIINYESSNEQN